LRSTGSARIGRAALKLALEQPELDVEVDLVLECTGRFTNREDAEQHVRAGARWVVLSGPTKSPDVPTIIHGVNRPDGETQIISCASCTTNNITPLVESSTGTSASRRPC
jgi:glyceraldehyde 3-phosphate dehydrogenase